MSICIGGVAVQRIEFGAFVWLFTGAIEEDEIDNARNRVRTVDGSGAVFQHLGSGQRTDWNQIDV